MAETQSAVNACDVVVLMDDENNALVDISGSSNSVEMEFTQQLGEYQVFGGGWVRRLACKRDASFTLQVVYTGDTNEALDLLKDWFFNYAGTKRSLMIKIPDDGAGGHTYYGEVFLESLSIPTDATAAEPILVAAALKPDGAWEIAIDAT